MKLLYITNGVHGSGGLERVLSIKASYLAEYLGYEVTILTLNAGNNTLFYEFSSKINFIDIEAQGNSLAYFSQYRTGIKNVLKQLVPDVISVCDDGLKGLLFPIIFGKKTPVVYERHVSKQVAVKSTEKPRTLTIKTKLLFSIMDFGAKRFDKFVVLTKGNQKEWNLNNCLVIPNPMPFKNTQQSPLINKKVLAVGKQGIQKSYDRLLKIWKLVHDKQPDWVLEIFGTQVPALKLAEQAQLLGIENVVHFHTPVKNIQEKYQASSLYVMSSRFEGFGMVLIEAMSFGIPCISFDCPHGPKDIITDKEDGLLIENGNIQDFADALISLMIDETKRKEMGVLAKKNVNRYSPDLIVPQWDTLFKSITHFTKYRNTQK